MEVPGTEDRMGPPPMSVLRTWKPRTVVWLAMVMEGPMLMPSTMGAMPLPKNFPPKPSIGLPLPQRVVPGGSTTFSL
jgi:hypothetical protein